MVNNFKFSKLMMPHSALGGWKAMTKKQKDKLGKLPKLKVNQVYELAQHIRLMENYRTYKSVIILGFNKEEVCVAPYSLKKHKRIGNDLDTDDITVFMSDYKLNISETFLQLVKEEKRTNERQIKTSTRSKEKVLSGNAR